jgi:ribonuclease VapC
LQHALQRINDKLPVRERIKKAFAIANAMGRHLMYIDASAIVAILGREDDGPALTDRIEKATTPLYASPTTIYEAVSGLARKKGDMSGLKNQAVPAVMIEMAQAAVTQFIEVLGIKEVMVSADIGRKALEAAKRYGRPVGHAADLNFGDCVAYACAKAYRVPLLPHARHAHSGRH